MALGVVLALSGLAIAPGVSAKFFGLAGSGLGLLGIAIGLRSAVGIRRSPGAPDAREFDVFWYGVSPALAYAGLSASAVAIVRGVAWGPTAVAADLMALLLVSIHAEWDLVTYLAPIAGGDRKRASRSQLAGHLHHCPAEARLSRTSPGRHGSCRR